MTWIKICGITNLKDAEEISELSINAMGFILSTESPRRVSDSRAKEIIKAVRNKGDKKIAMVGVFVNEEIPRVLECSENLKLDYTQLSGDEDVRYLEDLNERNKGVKVIKSIRIKKKDQSHGAEPGKEIKRLKGHADFVLLDSYSEKFYGGTGISFNWDIAKDCFRGIPIILSGGLNGENVRQAVDTVKPFGVDASSKLEAYPGKKDIYKVKRFVEALK